MQQSTLLRLLNAGNFQAAADQFPRWDRAGGKEVVGLLARRNAERALFLTPVTDCSADLYLVHAAQGHAPGGVCICGGRVWEGFHSPLRVAFPVAPCLLGATP